MSNTLPKIERLTGKDKLDALYNNGRPITEFPVKLLWLERQDEVHEAPVKIVVSVPKRKFKSAVKRNRIKRLIKEVYRLNKADLHKELEKKKITISIFVLYLGKEMPEYETLSNKIIVLLSRLIQDISERND